MGFEYVPSRKVVSIWRPIEFSYLGSLPSISLINVRILRGGRFRDDAPVFFKSFYVDNGEIVGGSKRFKFDVSWVIREMTEPFESKSPLTLGNVYLLANFTDYLLYESMGVFQVEIDEYEKNVNGEYLLVGNSVGKYPLGINEWMFGVNHSPKNGENMYMTDYYSVNKVKFLSDWNVRGRSVLECGLRESLYVSFFIGDKPMEGIRIKKIQKNGVIVTGVYQWQGLITNNTEGINCKIIVLNIGGWGINGYEGYVTGLSGLVRGNDVSLDSETVSYEVQVVGGLNGGVTNVIGEVEPNLGRVIGFNGLTEITETISVKMSFCEENDLTGRLHWLNFRGGMDSRRFRMFARKSNKITSQRVRKALNWNGELLSPNDRTQRSVQRKDIVSVVGYEVEELVTNEEAQYIEGLIESSIVYMESKDTFIPIVIEDGEIVPSDTDEGYRVVKIKFVLDNVNQIIE